MTIDSTMFGEPRTGLHAYRIFDIAVVDLGATIATSYVISNYYETDFKRTSLSMILLGVVVHKILRIDTGLNKKLGIN